MFPSSFAYHRPASVEEAVALIGANPDAKVLAGGHSLIPAMKLRLAMPEALIDLNRIDALREIAVNGEVTIGAMTTYAQLLDDAGLGERFAVIHDAADHVGDVQVRARGTLGGSIAHADPASDFTAVILALGARVTAIGPEGERTIEADDLFVDLFTTALRPDELLTRITIPAVAGTVVTAYAKHAHPASGYPVVGIAAMLTMEGSTVSAARIAVTGATSKATRLTAAETALTGQAADAAVIDRAAAAAAEGLEINGDAYASDEYRRHLVSVLTGRVIRQAIARAT
ncbi:MAG: xanthine dehydrogenase family protein subunit M [Chloroflexota bacterium]|nr:xanthine dehydrogenase family protein subunit M [Chloroflexota bacterium]